MFNISATERVDILSTNNSVFERTLLSCGIEATSTVRESVTAWALQHVMVKYTANRVAKRFNSWMFYQTYINSMIPHIV